MTMADPKQFTLKKKPVIYIGIFIDFYNQKNYELVDKIYEIIKLEKINALPTKNLYNLDVHQIIEIFLLLRSAYIVVRDKDKFMFNINNYID